ncbi:heat shock Hsp70 [Fusarium phyllophilum]|uniref:Heat shock Hsp70 n=1 Tax=Fusarium phyllophilum TaxID=47803 RepID=A0A8H5K2A7_9HYPO|nr:heat shock Hsp70 [Fusarium phyllophilum]
MVIATELGNISSGVAWAVGNSEPKFVTGWETQSSILSSEMNVHSALYYKGLRNRNNPKWGFQVADNPEVFTWFKHLIDRDKDLPADIRFSPELANAAKIMRKLHKKNPLRSLETT